ncbi:MAG: tetratricopeptide repeat protein, partial [Acetobacterales bacterium]
LLLGGLAGLATGRGDVGAAIAGAGANIAQQQFFGYTRGNEESADQAAMEYLDRTGISARGLLTVLDTLSGQELLVSERQDVYMRTHPLSRDRMSFVRQHVQDSPYSDEPPDPERERQLARVQAKLRAFTLPKGRLPRLFDESDDSVPSRYGRAIVAHRNAELEKAIGLMDSLLAEAPQDPYFHELRGQILFESQRGRDALDDYRRAVEIAPDEPQIRIGLAQVEIELNEPELLRDAVVHLNRVLHEETRNTFAWRQLAIAYGRLGEEGLSALCLAEEAAIQGRGEEALRLAKRAAGNLEDGSPAQLRARDLQATVERARKQ